jgi:fibronectin type 3 domain-containing protein
MLSAEGGDSYNLLAWDPVTTRADGSKYEGFVGYNVYRGTEKGWYDEMPLNKEPLRTNTYKDTAVVNNKTYYYTVRAVDSPIPPWKESLDSPEASSTSRDLTPPDKPKGLTVVPGVGRIFLTWNENKERDLAGYHVYRSTKSGRDYQRLTDKPINRTTFSDETVRPGILYYYAVTAVDVSGNESAMSKEQKAYAEKLR